MADEAPEEEDARLRRGAWFFEYLGVPGANFPAGVLAPSLQFVTTATHDAPGRRWIPYGARNIGGRVRALAQDPTDARTLYAGSASGGLHRTTDGGDTWTPVGGPADIWSVGAVAVAPSDPRVIVVGTGEILTEAAAQIPPPAVPGLGIFRSVDRAATPFTRLVGPPPVGGAAPSGACDRVAAIAIDPQHPHRFWAATNTGLWRWEPTSHNTPAAGTPAGGFQSDGLPAGFYTDVIVFGDPEETPGPGGTHRYLIIMAGRIDGTIHRTRFDRQSATAALAWTQIVSNLPGNATRVALAFCRANPRFVYAVAAVGVAGSFSHNSSPLVQSTDGGQTFTLRSQTEPPNPPITTQAWYSLALACHPTDPNIVVQGCLEVWRTMDGGATPFTQILDWRFHNDGIDQAQHADEHILMFDHEDRNRLWLGNDGGISMAPDVTADPSPRRRYWRKRSHGLQLEQFIDITVHPQFPYIAGGGLQDNGTYAGVGGRTWLHIGKGDGGALCYEPTRVNRIYTTWTGGRPVGMDAANSAAAAPGGVTIINDTPDVPASPRSAISATSAAPPPGVGGAPPQYPFAGVIELVQTNQVLAPQTGRVLLWNPATGAAPPIATATPVANAGALFTAVAVAPTHPTTHWWFGNAAGEVFATTTGTTNPATSVTAGLLPIGHLAIGSVTPPAAAASAIGRLISRIVVHPRNRNYVAIATGGDGSGTVAGAQGHVYLTLDGGANWRDITGLTGAGNRALPPCPTISLAFDPTPAIGDPQILYGGTLVGVWKLVGLPAANVAAMPAAAFPIQWNTFGNLADPAPGSEGKLPLLMINDLIAVTHPATPGAAAATYEHAPRHKLIAATFGRGMFECELGVPAAVPRHRLYLRQHVIEDGLHYPRPSDTTLNTAFNPASPNLFNLGGDPRFPSSPTPPAALAAGGVRFQPDAAYDIRVDNRTALFQFFEDRVDGVELDEELGVEGLLPAEANSIYVQVHNRGTHTVTDAEVLLFFADTAGAPPLPAVPNLPNDFWARFRANDPMPAAATPIAAGAADWRRIGRRTGLTVRPGDPLVVRFDFEPAANLSERNVSLLALTLSPANDALGAAPAPPTAIATLLTGERRAALRRVAVARLVRRVYLRDGVDDGGDLGTPALAFGARSPDVIVVQDEVDPVARFVDLADRRPTDRVTGARDNFVYVRVFNPTNAPVRVQVELWSAPASDPAASPSDNTRWRPVPQRTPPAGPAPAPGAPLPDTVDVPARGVAYARFVMRNVADPTPAAAVAAAAPHRAYLLAALVHAERTMLPGASPTPAVFEDAIPDRTAARDPGSFLRFFRSLASSRRAAMRIVPYL